MAALSAAALPGAAAAAWRGDPLAAAPFFVDPGTRAADAQREARQSGDGASAALLGAIASRPQSTWFIAADDALASGYVDAYFRRWDAQPGTMAQITLHGLPQQVCSGENAPGAASAAAYRHWIDGWARRIGGRPVLLLLEPDAIPASRCLSAGDRAVRLGLLRYAVRTLAALPRAAVYLDAGAGDWLKEREVAPLLRRAGIAAARGFALNTTHFDWTAAEVAYGMRLSRLLGGKHFIVNTSGNGRGPQVRRRFHVWCNPRGRALGPVPTLATPNPRVDALLWLQDPGISDGRCNGGPPVGRFWRDWALELARNAARAPDYPVLRRGA